jgi:hypothetical protein
LAPQSLKPKPIKAYCAWIGPDNRLRMKKARVNEDGIANVRRGPKGVKVTPLRTFSYKRRPCFAVVGNSGESLDVHGLKTESIVTSTELDELANNNYADQLMSELGRSTGDTVRDWLVVGAVALVLVLNIYSFNETKDALGAIAQMIAERIPLPAGASTGAGR